MILNLIKWVILSLGAVVSVFLGLISGFVFLLIRVNDAVPFWQGIFVLTALLCLSLNHFVYLRFKPSHARVSYVNGCGHLGLLSALALLGFFAPEPLNIINLVATLLALGLLGLRQWR